MPWCSFQHSARPIQHKNGRYHLTRKTQTFWVRLPENLPTKIMSPYRAAVFYTTYLGLFSSECLTATKPSASATSRSNFRCRSLIQQFYQRRNGYTSEPRFTNAPVHEQIFLRKKRLGLRTRKLATAANWQQRQAKSIGTVVSVAG
jgi:hypothetical protein